MDFIWQQLTNRYTYIPESQHHRVYVKLLQKLQRYLLISENSETIHKIQSSTKQTFLLLCYVEEVKKKKKPPQYSHTAVWGEKVLFCPSPVVSKCLF